MNNTQESPATSEAIRSVWSIVKENISDRTETQSLKFIERTIGTIVKLYEKLLRSKNDNIQILKDENDTLKEGLIAMQELYEEDRQTIENLNTQIKDAKEECNFIKKKYQVMWEETFRRLK